MTALLVFSGLTLVESSPAMAAEPVLVSGTVYADAQKDNVLDTAGPSGEIDLGVEGVAITLSCATPKNPVHPGWSTHTGASGEWGFAADTDWLSSCANDRLRVSLNTAGAAGDVYAVHSQTSADNAFASIGAENQQARTEPFSAEAAPAELNALVWPTWKLSLELPNMAEGLDGKAVRTGSEPWDTKVGAGYDLGADDAVVRSGDVTTFTWSVVASAEEALGDSFSAAVLEQTILLEDGAVANFTEIPGLCATGVPASEIRAFAGASDKVGTPIAAKSKPETGTTHVTLTCHLGEIGITTAATLLDTSIWASPDSVNGSTFTSQARVYGVNANGVATAQPDGPNEVGPIEITSMPRYDLAKHAPFSSGWTIRTVDGERVPGRQIYYPVTISTDRKEGVESFQQPVIATEDFWAQTDSDNGPGADLVDDLDYIIVECRPTVNYGSAGAIVGGINKGDAYSASSVSDSGKCEFERTAEDTTSPYKLSFSGIDTSGKHYPTKTNGGADLSAGPYYVASYEVIVFVPLSEIDAANGVMDDNVGALYAYNQVTGFDPVGLSGVSNYGDDNEPGFCSDRPTGGAFNKCDLLENGKRSNNVAGPTTVQMSPGSFSKSFLDHLTPWSHALTQLPGASGSHDGAATIQPGEVHQAQVVLINGGTPWNEAGLCDVFDNTTLKMAPLNKVAGMTAENAKQYDDDLYAYVHDSSLAGRKSAQEPNQKHYTIEYGSFDFGDDTANNGEFDVATNRFGGSWLNQANARCSDSATAWKPNPADVEGGIDNVNAIRAVAKDASVVTPGTTLYLMTAFEQRDTFMGGANDGKTIPAGTVAANYGQATTNTLNPGWSMPLTDASFKNRYQPQPESSRTDGDRWTVARAVATLDQRTITVDEIGGGEADFGNTGQTLSGSPVIWEIVTAISANSKTPGAVQNVVITQKLPKHVSYNAEMTAQIAGGTPATTAEVDKDGITTLTWLIGDVVPNDKIPSRIIYTDTDPLAPANTQLVANAEITADSILPVQAHKDAHTVVLLQSGQLQLQKSVDQTLDLQDDTQAYSLKVKNFSKSLSIEPVTVIEVLPYKGDATNDAAVNRTPASDFAGVSSLKGAVTATDFGGTKAAPGTTYYTTVAPEHVPQNLNVDTDASIWFTESDFGKKPGAPSDWSEVTAFKFVAENKLATESDAQKSGLILTFVTEQQGNNAGDLYANRFTAFSDTLASAENGFQLLTSNQTTVRVVGFSLGDLIWIDQDRDGKFDEAVDVTAPEGTKIEVYDSHDALVGAAKTNAEGRWILNDLPEGDYYALIPASEFAKGEPLSGYTASTVNSIEKPNTDLNEDEDHHAINVGKGVRSSGLITLSATIDGSTITGNEPLADNVGGLRPSPLTTDDFTNLTLDLALESVPGYEFAKTSDPVTGTAVNPGDTITYTLTGTNTGTSVLNPVKITDDLAGVFDNATLVSEPTVAIDGAPATDAQVTGTTLTWSGALQRGETVTVTYSVTMNDDATGVLLKNRAESTATPPGLPPIVPPPVETEHPTPGYTFGKTSNPVSGSPVAVGSDITYTLTGSNTGKTPLDVTVTDDLTGVLAHATLTGAPTAAVAGQPASTDVDLVGTDLTWTGTVEAGQSVTITYTVTVNLDAAGVLVTNRAVSEATPPGLPPITPPPAVTEHPTPGFTFDKTSDPVSGTAVEPGGTITYTLTGSNTGLTVLDPVVVTDDLAGVLEHATLTGDIVATVTNEAGDTRDGGASTIDETTLTWEGALAIGETVHLVYTVTLHDDAAGVIVNNRASASATPPGLPPIVPPTVETSHPTPGYTFWKSADPVSEDPVAVGESITYTLTGHNNGETVLDPVEITDDLSKVLSHATLAGEVTAVITDTSDASYEAEAPKLDGATLSWSGMLAPGQSVAVSYTVTVNEGAEGATLTNSAHSIATPPGLPPVEPPKVTTEHPVPGYTLAKTSDPESGEQVERGQSIGFTLTGTNTGATVLDPVVISDNLAGVLNNTTLEADPVSTIVDADGTERSGTAPTLEGTALTWQGPLAVGERVEITYSVRVNDEAGEVTIENVVSSTATPPGGTVIVPPSVTTTHTTTKPPSSGTNAAGSSKRPGSGPKVDGGSTLSVTGADLGAGVGAAGLLLLLAGAALMLRSRRKAETAR